MKTISCIRKLKVYPFCVLFVLYLILNSTVAFGSKPTVKISSSALFPRLSMLDTAEEWHCRNLLSYDQQFGKNISINTFVEYGSENDHFRNPFRVHHLTADFEIREHKFSIGRLAIWNALQNARVDGAKLDVNTKQFGSLSIMGGFDAVSDFSDTSFTDNTYFMTTWSKGRIGKNLVLSFWVKGDDENTDSFAGLQFNTKKFDIRISNAITFDIGESKLNYAKIRLFRKFGKHTAGIGFRQKRFELYDYFDSVNETGYISPTISFNVNSLLSSAFFWRNQLSYRLGAEGKTFLVSSMNYKKFALSLLGGIEHDNIMYGLILGSSHQLSDKFSLGGSVAFNAQDYGDFADLRSSTGTYGWIGWQPYKHTKVKLFGRFFNNSYFKEDGRGGIVINVAL